MLRLDKRAGPIIFTGLGCIGVFATAALGVKAGMEAERILRDRPNAKTLLEKSKATWRAYIFVTLSAALTTGCIVAGHRLSAKQIAALSSVAAASGTTFSSYRSKVRELVGKEEEQKIYEAVRAEENWLVKPAPPGAIDGEDDKEYLYYDAFGDRYFKATKPRVLSAIYHLNRMFQLTGMQSYGNFCEYLGVEADIRLENKIWDAQTLLEAGFVPIIDVFGDEVEVDGRKAISISFDVDPWDYISQEKQG